MLKEATKTISIRMMNMATFSSFSAAKKAWFISIQSRTR